jgi:membrane-bound metal-dependent hydrolase YbcI (DUF457 family)
MTTFEHGMVGATCAMAVGLHERHGWKVAALSALASIAVDWDGLTILYSNAAFAAGHRVWGHNLLAVVVSGLLVGIFDYKFDLVTRFARLFVKLSRAQLALEDLECRAAFSRSQLWIWIGVSVVAGLLHLPSDLVVSGSASLPDWKLKLLWPFSDQGWVYPMVRWGDPGITLIFVAGAFAMTRWSGRVVRVAQLTVLSVIVYCVVRGTLVV